MNLPSFSEWLDRQETGRLDEARVLPKLAPVMRPTEQPRPSLRLVTPPKASSADLPTDQRLRAGWKGEDLVINVLNRFIGPTRATGQTDDQRAKLDATIQANGRAYFAQIKMRESGDDILVEWYKSYPNLKGRDQVTRAELYVVMDSTQQWVYIIDANRVKEVVKQMVEEWERSGKPPTYNSAYGQVKFQQSRDIAGAWKVIAYLKPTKFTGHPPDGFPARIQIPEAMKGGPVPATKAVPTPVPQQVQGPGPGQSSL